jgi:hypothetical protein
MKKYIKNVFDENILFQLTTYAGTLLLIIHKNVNHSTQKSSYL